MLQIKTLKMKLSIEIDKSVLLLGLSGLLTLQSGTNAQWHSMKIPLGFLTKLKTLPNWPPILLCL